MRRRETLSKTPNIQKRFESTDRKSEIYDKALDLFVKNGYDATPLSMLSETLGMSKGNLFHHFSSKENLLFEIQLDFLKKRYTPIIEEAERIPDPADRISYFLRQVTLLNTSTKANRVLVHEVQRLDKSHQSEIAKLWRRGYELISASIKELQQSGRAPKRRVPFVTFMLLSMPFWVVYWFDYSRQANASELAETIVEAFKGILSFNRHSAGDDGA
jgi:TetR/AcrR family transcriptional regulator, cholesterol catabolism regulator